MRRRDYTGSVYGVNKVLYMHDVKNKLNRSTYECVDIFGNTFSATTSMIRNKNFENKFFNKDTLKIVKVLRACWNNMIKRCYKESINSKYYRDKGIVVCPEWLSSNIAFYKWAAVSGYKLGLTIDRIDSDKEYSPDNCRWVTRAFNSRNNKRVLLSREKVSEIRCSYFLLKGFGNIKNLGNMINLYSDMYGVKPSTIKSCLYKTTRWSTL